MNKLQKIILPICPKRVFLHFLKKDGVVFGRRFDCAKTVSFGSEPYLVTIGDDVKLTNRVEFITHDGAVQVLRVILNNPKLDFFSPIRIGNNVFIGNHATILPGVTIGDNVIIGYGSIVTKDIPSNSVAAGVPAKVIETLSEYQRKKTPSCVETKLLGKKAKRRFLLERYSKKSSSN
jgi:acetyltransferase-like isoleucine patch superfamily enzyme